jgi:hypothetical protein
MGRPTNVQVEVQSSQPSVVSNLAKTVIKKICERQCFTISELSCTVLYEITTG